METKLFSQDIQSGTQVTAKQSHRSSANQQGSELAQTDKSEKTQASSLVSAKQQLNAAILQSTVDVNANSLSLVFKTALAGINDALKETLGDNAIKNAYDSGVDISPEATADRIVSLSTAFFSSYQQQHPDLSQEEALTKFTDIISGGINTGFGEARDILSGLNVLEGDIANNIDLTYELVQQKLTAFVTNFNEQNQ